MNAKISKKRLLGIVFLLGLTFLIPVTVRLSMERQKIRGRAEEEEVIRLSFEPSQGLVVAGQPFLIRILLEGPELQQVSAANIKLSYDKNVIDVFSLICGSDFPTIAENFIDSDNGYIYLGCGIASGSQPFFFTSSGAVVLGQFEITAKNNPLSDRSDRTEIAFINNYSLPYVADPVGENIFAKSEAGVYSLSETPKVGKNCSVESDCANNENCQQGECIAVFPAPSFGTVKIKLKIRFSGIYTKGPDQKIRVQVGKENNLLEELAGVNVAADSHGIYQSDLMPFSSKIVPDYGYYFLIKGPKHFQAKYCQNSGQSGPCSSGRIILNEGENVLDFSGYPLLGGDLPPQDGVANSLDAITATNCLRTPQDQNCLEKSDLNFDGIINTLDMRVVNEAINNNLKDEK